MMQSWFQVFAQGREQVATCEWDYVDDIIDVVVRDTMTDHQAQLNQVFRSVGP